MGKGVIRAKPFAQMRFISKISLISLGVVSA
jgi:hypothetical protein